MSRSPAPLRLATDEATSPTTADQIAAFGAAKSSLSMISRSVEARFNTPASRLTARRPAADLVKAARDLERSFA